MRKYYTKILIKCLIFIVSLQIILLIFVCYRNRSPKRMRENMPFGQTQHNNWELHKKRYLKIPVSDSNSKPTKWITYNFLGELEISEDKPKSFDIEVRIPSEDVIRIRKHQRDDHSHKQGLVEYIVFDEKSHKYHFEEIDTNKHDLKDYSFFLRKIGKKQYFRNSGGYIKQGKGLTITKGENLQSALNIQWR